MNAIATSARARGATIALLLVSVALLPIQSAYGMGAPGASPAKTSLPVIERQVMCVTCKIPLNVAQSPQADRERAFIQRLIDEGRDEDQIKQSLVDQYGASVLGFPGAHGFDLTVYLVPIGAVLVLLAAMVVLLPRWRRRAPAPVAAASAGATGAAASAGATGAAASAGGADPAARLAAEDAARLESDMARFD